MKRLRHCTPFFFFLLRQLHIHKECVLPAVGGYFKLEKYRKNKMKYRKNKTPGTTYRICICHAGGKAFSFQLDSFRNYRGFLQYYSTIGRFHPIVKHSVIARPDRLKSRRIRIFFP